MPFNITGQYSTEADHLTTIAGWPNHPFTEVSGIDTTFSSVKVFDGTSRKSKTIVSSEESPNITLRKPFAPKHDAPLIKFMERFHEENARLPESAKRKLTVNIESLEPNSMETTGFKTVCHGCQIVSIRRPAFNSGSNDTVAMLEFELSTDYVGTA